MSTFVICPVLNEWQLTRAMLLSLDADQVDDVLILDNGSTDITSTAVRSWQRQRFRGIGHKLHQTRRPDLSIYGLWNHGFERARAMTRHPFMSQAWYVLITNNDIVLPVGALSALRAPLANDPDAWVTYPDYDAAWDAWRGHVAWRETRGVLSSGGMLGACFMLAGHRIPWRPLITDLNYRWWFADDHLAECIEQEGGKQIRIVGLPVKHVNEGTAQHYPDEIYAKKLRDRGLWLTRESRGRRAVDRRAIIPR